MLSRVARSVCVACLSIAACAPADDGALTAQQLLDPEACKGCHPEHYRQWSGSSHAYFMRDPLFEALLVRGLRETKGKLKRWMPRLADGWCPLTPPCARCHDHVELDALGEQLAAHPKQVTCFHCHAVEAVEGTNNKRLRFATDGVMRGAIRDPVETPAHASAYSPLVDRNRPESSELCGACHDTVASDGLKLERTYLEWKESLFSRAPGTLACGRCHTRRSAAPASSEPGMPERQFHDHAMPGVNIALFDAPEAEPQREAVARSLDSTLLPAVCVEEEDGKAVATVSLENLGAAHSWPSGAAMLRRAWVELVAYNGDQQIFASGVARDEQPLARLPDTDPAVWEMRDILLDGQGRPVLYPWQAKSVRDQLLPAPTSHSPIDPLYRDTHVRHDYVLPQMPTRVTMRVRIRPVGLDIVDDLIATGDLDPAVRRRVPTFTLKASLLEWTRAAGTKCVPEAGLGSR